MIIALLEAMRPHQWVKNLLVLAPLAFAHRLDDPAAALGSVAAFVVFCMLSSSVYLLNDVLDRHLGAPITLSIILLEVGWRLGLPLEGVSFPGHFLVRCRGATEHLLIDPFDGGRIRFESEAQEILDQEYGGMVRMQPAFLRAASKLDTIRRLLLNLKGQIPIGKCHCVIYLRQRLGRELHIHHRANYLHNFSGTH